MTELGSRVKYDRPPSDAIRLVLRLYFQALHQCGPILRMTCIRQRDGLDRHVDDAGCVCRQFAVRDVEHLVLGQRVVQRLNEFNRGVQCLFVCISRLLHYILPNLAQPLDGQSRPSRCRQPSDAIRLVRVFSESHIRTRTSGCSIGELGRLLTMAL